MATLIALVLLLLAGLAVDVSMMMAAKNRIRRTMDGAGIAVATHFRNQQPTADEVTAFVANWVESNYPDYKLGEHFNLDVTWSEGVADLTANVRVDTIFMDLVGFTEIAANVPVRVISETRGLEVALALDNTGSMNGTEMLTLRSSVNKFVNVLFDEAADPSTIKIGMVPFVAAVNIKNSAELANWVDLGNSENLVIMDDVNMLTGDIDPLTPPAVAYHGENFTPRTSHAYFYKQMAMATGKPHWYDTWRGCVEARTEPLNGEELDVTDKPPNEAYPQTLWVPYFWPDEPDPIFNTTALGGSKDNGTLLKTSDSSLVTQTDTGEYRVRNNFINDLLTDTTLTFEEVLSSTLKYADPANALDITKKESYSNHITRGPGKSCPNPIEPLTSDRTHLNNLLLTQDYLYFWNEGGSNLAQGIVWAWRVLSSEPPFTQGEPYLDADGNANKAIQKVLVVFFAGGNGIVYEPNPLYSDYSAYGYIVPNGRLGNKMGDKDLDTKTLKVCQNARKPAGDTSREKILIYAIGFQIPSGDPVINLMQECTGNSDQVFLIDDTSQMSEVFESLAKDLTKLRVVW